MFQKGISFVGAGRVAGALCTELYRAGFSIDMIVSKTESNGGSLASSCGAEWSSDPVFPVSSGIIIVAVPDHQLVSVLNDLIIPGGSIVAHTAGSLGLEIFPETIPDHGIFYPLQTFSDERKVDFNGLPFLLESDNDKTMQILVNLANALGGKVYNVDSERRKIIHLAAVFACNFTNHMLTLGNDLVKKAGFSFELLEPLIKETVLKALDNGPENSQTGPAVRNDHNTLEKHMDLLSFSPELQKLYNDMTSSIINYYKK
jgi:predicted short-subunit dehydrogenase-like oxidoreductase (DUF2520 family)